MLITIEDVLTSDELAVLHTQLTATSWENGVSTAGPQAALVKNNQQVAE